MDSIVQAIIVIKIHCAADSAVPKEFIEQDRFYDFLVGLNPKFDQVRIQISIHSYEITFITKAKEMYPIHSTGSPTKSF